MSTLYPKYSQSIWFWPKNLISTEFLPNLFAMYWNFTQNIRRVSYLYPTLEQYRISMQKISKSFDLQILKVSVFGPKYCKVSTFYPRHSKGIWFWSKFSRETSEKYHISTQNIEKVCLISTKLSKKYSNSIQDFCKEVEFGLKHSKNICFWFRPCEKYTTCTPKSQKKYRNSTQNVRKLFDFGVSQSKSFGIDLKY